jgi:hypothetical protein
MNTGRNTDHDFQFPGGRACNPPLAPAPAFPPGFTRRKKPQGVTCGPENEV